MTICENEKCFGCSACANVCPKHAIQMKENAHGEMFPVIDESRCIDCGLCRKVCPSLQPMSLYHPIRSFAAWANQKRTREKAASAGIVSAVSKTILKEGGVVFGTCFKDSRLVFDYIDNIDDLDNFKGSKYIHADVGNTYTIVKKFIEEQREVLFVGTPCQIAGLRKYLRKDFDNLLTIDLVCHGVSPQKYLYEYIRDYLGIDTFAKVIFRGEEGNKLTIYDGNNKILYAQLKFIDLYSMAYTKGLIMRENCYSCPFASSQRGGDITAGDFWGIDKSSLDDHPSDVEFVSLALANTQRGLHYLQKSDLHLVERNLSEVISTNRQFSAPCAKHPEYKIVRSLYNKKGFVYALKKTDLSREIARFRIKYKLHRLLHWFTKKSR